MATFDWYQGTVRHPLNDVLEGLYGLTDGLKLSHQRGMHGYASTAVLGNYDHGPVARVWHGGTHEHPHIVISGHWAQAGAELVRARFPEHSVSRLDVREDYTEDGAYDRIQPQLIEVAKAHRVKVGTAGDHLLTLKGRTCYLGSTSSAVRLRLYDKREEVLSKLPPSGEDRAKAWGRVLGQGYFPESGVFPDSWARLEAEIHPQTKEAKHQFSTIEPIQALGSAAWMREAWRAVAGLDLRPVQVGRGYRQQDDERAYRYLLAQYGGVLRRLACDLGSWECVGKQLGDDLAEPAGGNPAS